MGRLATAGADAGTPLEAAAASAVPPHRHTHQQVTPPPLAPPSGQGSENDTRMISRGPFGIVVAHTNEEYARSVSSMWDDCSSWQSRLCLRFCRLVVFESQ